MKIVRWAAAAALTLISLMNAGIALGGDGAGLAVRVVCPLMGVLGFAAVYGLLRRRHWGAPSALAVSAVDVVTALIALATSVQGASTGLTVSLVALVLTGAAAYAGRASQPQPQPTNLSN